MDSFIVHRAAEKPASRPKHPQPPMRVPHISLLRCGFIRAKLEPASCKTTQTSLQPCHYNHRALAATNSKVRTALGDSTPQSLLMHGTAESHVSPNPKNSLEQKKAGDWFIPRHCDSSGAYAYAAVGASTCFGFAASTGPVPIPIFTCFGFASAFLASVTVRMPAS